MRRKSYGAASRVNTVDNYDFNGYDLDNFDYDRYKQRADNSNRNRNRKKAHKKRTRNRIIIVSVFVVLFIVFVIVITSCSNAVCSGCSGKKAEEEQQQAEEAMAKATQPAAQPAADLEFNKPNIKDDGKSKGMNDGGLYVWNKQAFELFFGNDTMAERYAELMNKAADNLGSSIKTYSIIVPNHTEMGLPDRLKNTDDGASTQPQDVYIKASYSNMAKNVVPINAYNKLSEHCNEYVYFASDHHWTGLGAYYAYTAFAEKAKLPVLNLADCTEEKIEGFQGTFTGMVSSELNKDTVSYWEFPYEVTVDITNTNGEELQVDSTYYDESDGYGVFIYGDNPLEVIKSQSPSAKNEKVAIIHESYGNAFVPYLTYDYSEVYSIDFRSWNGSLKSFCQQKGITNVIFLNGVMSSATQVQLDSIENIL